MDEAWKSRWEPCTFNGYLDRRLGAEKANIIMRWASKPVAAQGPQDSATKRYEQEATRSRCLVAEMLLNEYAVLKSHGRNPTVTNLQEDRVARERMCFARNRNARRLTVVLREPEKENKTGAARLGSERVCMTPAPRTTDGKRIPTRAAREVFDCVAWDTPGQLWSGHLHPEQQIGIFEAHPHARADARLCGCIRDEACESEQGRLVPNSYVGVL